MNLHDANELIYILLMIRQQVFYFNKNEIIFLFCLNNPKILFIIMFLTSLSVKHCHVYL